MQQQQLQQQRLASGTPMPPPSAGQPGITPQFLGIPGHHHQPQQQIPGTAQIPQQMNVLQPVGNDSTLVPMDSAALNNTAVHDIIPGT